jgi:hypothetical protein
VLRRIVGACWERWSATDGGRCAGGCRREELMMVASGGNRPGVSAQKAVLVIQQCVFDVL